MSLQDKHSHSHEIKDIKLSAILEMTKAINNNLSTSQLLDIYQDILENRLSVGKLVLFSFEDDWKCILKYGVDKDFNHLEFDAELLKINEIQTNMVRVVLNLNLLDI